MFLRIFLRLSRFACIVLAVGSACAFAQSPAPVSAPPDVNSPATPIVQASQTPATAQPAPVTLTPGETYKQAMHPLDVVRSELGNWSDPELQALSVGVKMARDACDNAKPEDYRGDDLY